MHAPTRPLRLACAAAVLALAALSGAAPPASAHASLTRLDPADGSVLTTAPREVRLFFDEEMSQNSTLIVSGPAGRVDSGTAKGDGDEVSTGLTIPPKPTYVGTYTVAYRVVSLDGHVVAGRTTFEYRPPGVEAAPAGADGDTSPSGGPDPRVLGAVVIAAGLVALILLNPRRRRR